MPAAPAIADDEYDGAGGEQEAEEPQQQSHAVIPPAPDPAGCRHGPRSKRATRRPSAANGLEPVLTGVPTPLPAPTGVDEPKLRCFMLKLRPSEPPVRASDSCPPASRVLKNASIACDDGVGARAPAPGFRRQRLDVLLVGDIPEFDQHRRDVRRLEHPEAGRFEGILVQLARRCASRRPACGQTAPKMSWFPAWRDRSGCRRRRAARRRDRARR